MATTTKVPQISFERPFGYVFKDPSWVTKVLMGGLMALLSMFLVGAFVLMGYQRKMFLKLKENPNAPMPEIEFGEDLSAGLPIFGIFICYYIPIMIVSVLLGMIPCLGQLLSFAISLGLIVWMPVALSRYYQTNRFGAAFEFGAIYEFIRVNFNNAALFVAIVFLAQMAAGLGVIACIVGVFFTGFWAMCVQTVALADMVRAAEGAPVPVGGPAGGGQPVQASAFVSQQPGKGVSFEEARKVQDEVQAVLKTDDVSAKINAAARLMTGKQFKECIEAYQAIAAQHPDQQATCEAQIGAAYFFLGQYQKAIEYYEAAKAHGEDAGMMDDNIREAKDALLNK